MPSDFRLYPLALPESEAGNAAGSSNPLEGRVIALEELVRQGAVRSRKSLRDALALSGIPDMRVRLQALSVSSGSGNGGGSPSPSPEPTNDLAATITAVKARLPLAQYSQSKIAAIEAFVTALWNGGVWQKLTRLFVNVSPTSSAALTCWKSGVLLGGGSGVLLPWQHLELPTGVTLSCTIPGMNPLDFHFFGRSKDELVPTYAAIDWNSGETVGPVVQMGDWLSTGYALDTIGLNYYTIYSRSSATNSHWGQPVMRQQPDVPIGAGFRPNIFFDYAGEISAAIVQAAQNTARVIASAPSPWNRPVPAINESDLNATRTQFRIHGRTAQSSHRRWFASSMGNALTDPQGLLLSEQIETLIGALRS